MSMLAEGLFNNNGISAVAAACFTGLFACLGILIKGVFDTRAKTSEAKDEATSARESAAKASKNTTLIGNGFVDRVDRKLDSLLEEQRVQGNALREHLEWHLDQPRKE